MLFVLGTAHAKVQGLEHYQSRLQQAADQLLKALPLPNANSVDLQMANQLFQQEKFPQSLAANKPWARVGSIQARLEIGYLYEFGRGVPKDGQRAALFYYAAIRPNRYTQKPIARGVLDYFGLSGHRRDYLSAARWFRMAAELGDDRY